MGSEWQIGLSLSPFELSALSLEPSALSCFFSPGLSALSFQLLLSHVLLAGAVQVSFFIAAFNGLALVILALAFYKPYGQLDFAAFEIEFERYQGVPFFVDLAVQAFDFLLVQKQLARSERIMVAVVGKRVGTDVQLVDEHFTIDDPGIRVLDIGLAEPERFDLGALQNHAGFIFIDYKVVMPGPAVDGDHFFGVLWHNCKLSAKNSGIEI